MIGTRAARPRRGARRARQRAPAQALRRRRATNPITARPAAISATLPGSGTADRGDRGCLPVPADRPHLPPAAGAAPGPAPRSGEGLEARRPGPGAGPGGGAGPRDRRRRRRPRGGGAHRRRQSRVAPLRPGCHPGPPAGRGSAPRLRRQRRWEGDHRGGRAQAAHRCGAVARRQHACRQPRLQAAPRASRQPPRIECAAFGPITNSNLSLSTRPLH